MMSARLEMWRRMTTLLLLLSLSILLSCVESTSSRIDRTAHFCSTLLQRGDYPHEASPSSTLPFKLFAFWLMNRTVVQIMLGCTNDIPGDILITGAAAQVRSNGIPCGSFLRPCQQHQDINTVSCPPGINNTVYNFTESEHNRIDFYWVPSPEMNWDNVSIHVSAYKLHQQFWLAQRRLTRLPVFAE